MKRVTYDRVTYVFGRDVTPVLTVEPGEEILFETLDARGSRSFDPSVGYVPPPPPTAERTNPATGPVLIRGAEPGDVLVVGVVGRDLGAYGYVSARSNIGVLRDRVKTPLSKAVRVEDEVIHFAEGILVPTRPMIGTIGVAPLSQGIAAFHPGSHGGNMDCNDVSPGSRLFLPVFVDGALFALGDVHASMGDGETAGGGLDISANVIVRLDLIKSWSLRRPIIETTTHLVIIYNAANIQDAVRGVVGETVDLFSSKLGLSVEETIALVSTAGDVGICQACEGPLDVVVGLRMPKLFTLQ